MKFRICVNNTHYYIDYNDWKRIKEWRRKKEIAFPRHI